MRTPWTRSLSHVGAWVTRVTRSSKSARSTTIETRSASAVIGSLRFGFCAAQAFGVCGGAGREEGLECASGGAALGELLRELHPFVEADVASGDRRPVTLFVLIEETRVDPLPLARDHPEPALHVGRDRYEPGRRRKLPAGAALLAAARGRPGSGGPPGGRGGEPGCG